MQQLHLHTEEEEEEKEEQERAAGGKKADYGSKIERGYGVGRAGARMEFDSSSTFG